MQTQTKQIICQVHQQECTSIDITPDCKYPSRHCCSQCQKNRSKNRVLLYNDAQNFFQEMKKIYQEKKTLQMTKNIEILTNLASMAMSQKTNYNQSLDKLNNNIKQQITIITDGQDKLNMQLEKLDVESYLAANSNFVKQDSYYQQVESILEQQLKAIQGQYQISDCLTILSSIDKQIITLISEPFKFQGARDQQQKSTTKLNFLCQEHSQKIRFLNLNQQEAFENRILCDQCIAEKKGQFTPLQNAQKLWLDYELKQKEQIDEQFEKCTRQLKYVLNEIELLQQKHNLIIWELTKTFRSHKKQAKKQHLEELKKVDKNWATLSREDVLQIAEMLSKQNFQEILKQKKYKEVENIGETINVFLVESVLSLKQAETIFFEKLEQFIKLNTMLSPKEKAEDLKNIKIESFTKILSPKKNIMCVDFQIKLNCQKNYLSSYQQIFHLSYSSDQPQKQMITQEDKEIIIQSQELEIHKPINYELVPQNDNTLSSWCGGIAMNQEQTVLVAGCDRTIKVFEFKEGQLKQVAQLTDHTSYVRSLYFMKKSNQFVSGSEDRTLIVWSQNKQQEWQCQQVLKHPQNNGFCVIMNFNEDIMISSGLDHSIKVWIKQDVWEFSQTLIGHKNYIRCLNLNESQNQLVSCGSDCQILITQIDDNKKFTVIQTIKVEIFGYRICFVGDNIIAFQPNMAGHMDIYEVNSQNKFAQSKQVKVQAQGSELQGFPQIFHKGKSIIVSKNGQIINLIKLTDRGEMVLEQSINLSHNDIEGAISNDGEYLITHHGYQCFQVRKWQ